MERWTIDVKEERKKKENVGKKSKNLILFYFDFIVPVFNVGDRFVYQLPA